MPDLTRLPKGSLGPPLMAWAQGDRICEAAVHLLIWHDFWLRRADFIRAAMDGDAEMARINWGRARKFVDSGPRASTGELAVLDFAVAVGENRYRLSSLGTRHAEEFVYALAHAAGVSRLLVIPE